MAWIDPSIVRMMSSLSLDVESLWGMAVYLSILELSIKKESNSNY
jgi:hypothetical protein